MFKFKRTQFAIRKLAKGTAAVLLSLTFLANSSAPIVSAASDAVQTELATENTEIDKTTSAESETSQGAIITDESAGVNASVEETQENAVTSENSSLENNTQANETESVETPESTIPETPAVSESTTTEKVEENQNPTTTPVVENTEEKDEETSENKDDSAKKEESAKTEAEKDKETADKKDKPTVGITSPEELKKYIEEVAATHPLGIAGIFHIFGNEVDGKVHIAGNIATDKLNTGDFGTKPDATSNLTIGDIHYINGIDNLTQINGNNKLIIFGPDIEYQKSNDPSKLEVKVDGNWKTINIPYDNVLQVKEPLDIQGQLTQLGNKSDEWIKQEQTEGVKADFVTDPNHTWIDVSEAIQNAGDSKDPIYVTIDADHLDNLSTIIIKGIPAGVEAPIIILNVTNIQNGNLTIQSHLRLEYTDGPNVGGNSEAQSQANKLLWNFGTALDTLTIANGNHLGSILATNAHITTNVNVDGNIIGDKITIGGESHRWDLIAPPLVEVEKPEDPKPEPEDPKPEPEDPKPEPEDPKPESNPDPEPDKPAEPDTPNVDEEIFVTPLPEEVPEPEETPSAPEEDFVRPLPEQEDDLKDETTPQTSETKEKTVSPLPESVVETTTAKAQEETATPQATSVVTSTENEIALPETGEKKNNLITMGLVMTGLATAIATLGLAIKKKKN